ncbi:hypothetical protein [Nocardiopsis halotolerans]|uniref:hypothetical protein n=1 Tax=Nocardiopsis halotolerans TaxID=124252 RepID=UPI000475E895|nr:hypothetical protein [Nocardiopsis halotolerans]
MNSLTRLWVTLSTFLVPASKKEDKGAGIVEYAAILILVAAVAVAIFSLNVPTLISDSIGSSIDDILSSEP